MVSSQPINRWLIAIAGFRQDRNSQVGMQDLWLSWWRAQYPLTAVEMYEWSDDVSELANRIERYSSNPDVVIAGYSWGGMTATMLCDELRQRSIEVRHLVLTDAVYRHWFPAGNWRVLTRFSQIVVPANVKRVTWYRQKNNWPAGHDVTFESVRTDVSGPHDAGRIKHGQMDEYRAFQIAAREAAIE